MNKQITAMLNTVDSIYDFNTPYIYIKEIK